MTGRKIAILTAGGAAPAIMVNAVAARFPDAFVILEQAESKGAFLRRRARNIGWFRTLGQFPVMVMSRFLKPLAQKRFTAIEDEFGISMDWPEDIKTHKIGSANDGSLGRILQDEKADLLFIVGARMLSRRTLESLPCPAVNFHAGMTPDYRGLNGGYWALAEGRPERFGGTVHFVDEGVDTGRIIASIPCTPGKGDSILTCQHAITAQCADRCVTAIEAVLNGTDETRVPAGKSAQHYHPTFWFWLWTGFTKGVW